jgi:hypothetical protein
MSGRLTIGLLAGVMLLSCVSPTRVGAAWLCEGRICGTTLFYCCCNNPAGERDIRCVQPTAGEAGAFACPTACNCVMVVNPDMTISPTPVVPLVHIVALLPSPFSPSSPSIPAETVIRIETRGPPPSFAVLLPLGLRAPPLAWRSLVRFKPGRQSASLPS